MSTEQMIDEGDGYASSATAYAKHKGKLVCAQLSTAKTIKELLDATRKHFKAPRALALVHSERHPKA